MRKKKDYSSPKQQLFYGAQPTKTAAMMGEILLGTH